jgi:hypothetical protein
MHNCACVGEIITIMFQHIEQIRIYVLQTQNMPDIYRLQQTTKNQKTETL